VRDRDEGFVEGLGGVLGDVVGRVCAVTDEADFDNEAVAGDCVPEVSELGVGKVGAFNEDVKVRVPALLVDGPVDLEEGDAAVDAFLPEFGSAEFLEGVVEFVEKDSERFVVGLDGESEEAKGTLFDDFDNVESDGAGTFVGTGEAEAIVASGAGDAIDVGIVEALEYVSVCSAVLEVLLTGKGLCGAVESFVDACTVALPAGVTEADGEGVWFSNRCCGVGKSVFNGGDFDVVFGTQGGIGVVDSDVGRFWLR